MATYVHDSDDLTPLMTTNDAPSPNVVSASSALWPVYGAFAHSVVWGVGGVWLSSNGQTTGWLKFDFGSGNTHIVLKYTLSFYSGSSVTRAPKSWTLQGSNNDVDWDVLDTQTNVIAWSSSEMRTYSFANSTAYRYYKLNITANQGDSDYVAVGELELIAGETPPPLIDLNTEIKASEEIITDLTSEIIAGLESLTDLNLEIIVGDTSIIDLKSEISADFLTNFADLSSEVSTGAEVLKDLYGEVQAGHVSQIDLLSEISSKAQIISDLSTEIRVITYPVYNLNTEITVLRSKWWLNTEIKVGCSAKWNFNTEWNPNRFLNTEIEVKKPYAFSFTTQTGADYSITNPEVELLIPGYSRPLRTLFLDYLPVGNTNEYLFQLWWARGLYGRNTLKNVKIQAQYINTLDSGGYEVVTCDWLSCKVGSGIYQTVNETPLVLGDILCDSKLDITLRVECRDCSLTRGLVFFRLVFTGDYHEPVYGGTVVYRDRSIYHSGLFDDYRSNDFICRMLIAE